MVWRASNRTDQSANDTYMFTGVLFNRYSPPNGFYFDIFDSDPPIMDDPIFIENNVQQRIDLFIATVVSMVFYFFLINYTVVRNFHGFYTRDVFTTSKTLLDCFLEHSDR